MADAEMVATAGFSSMPGLLNTNRSAIMKAMNQVAQDILKLTEDVKVVDRIIDALLQQQQQVNPHDLKGLPIEEREYICRRMPNQDSRCSRAIIQFLTVVYPLLESKQRADLRAKKNVPLMYDGTLFQGPDASTSNATALTAQRPGTCPDFHFDFSTPPLPLPASRETESEEDSNSDTSESDFDAKDESDSDKEKAESKRESRRNRDEHSAKAKEAQDMPERNRKEAAESDSHRESDARAKDGTADAKQPEEKSSGAHKKQSKKRKHASHNEKQEPPNKQQKIQEEEERKDGFRAVLKQPSTLPFN